MVPISLENVFQSSLCIHLMLKANCKAFVVIYGREILQRVRRHLPPLPWLAPWLPFTHMLSLQSPLDAASGSWLPVLLSCLRSSGSPWPLWIWVTLTASAVLHFSSCLSSLCRAQLESLPCLSEKKLLSSLLVFQPCDKAPTALEPLEQGKGNESSVHLQREELMPSCKTWRAREISWNGTKLNAFTLHCSINAK